MGDRQIKAIQRAITVFESKLYVEQQNLQTYLNTSNLTMVELTEMRIEVLEEDIKALKEMVEFDVEDR